MKSIKNNASGFFSAYCLLLTAYCLLLLLLSTGCASKWAFRTEQPDINLQWPYQPARAKVIYVMTLNGFVRSSSSAQSLLNAAVYGESGGEGGDDSFILPVAVSTGSDGRLAVADIGCKCVHFFVPEAQKYVRIFDAESEALKSPVSVVFDEDLRLYVSDSMAGKVVVFDSEGEFLFSIRETGSGRLKRPTGLAYNDHEKLLYVVDTPENRIHAFNKNGEPVFSFGQRGEGEGQFNLPAHIFWSRAGVLYVTDTMNFRIAVFDEAGRFKSSFGRHGDGSGDFAMPKGVAADKDGAIYVVDSLFDNIQLFGKQGEFLLTVGKRGGDFAEFWLPSGIFIDDTDILYIADTYNRRVQIYRITGQYDDGKF